MVRPVVFIMCFIVFFFFSRPRLQGVSAIRMADFWRRFSVVRCARAEFEPITYIFVIRSYFRTADSRRDSCF